MTRSLGRFLRRNTIALLALFLALGGTSYAAANLISGASIKPHTIAKNRLTNKAIKQLKGNRGVQGVQGLRGPTGAQGVQGAAGAQGPAGTARAYAHVNVDGTLDASRSKNITAVSNPSAGEYCVTINPALGIDTTKVPWVVSVDYNTSPGNRLFAFYSPFSCTTAGQMGVLTANEDGGGGTTFTFSNEAFSIIVP